MDYVTNKLKNLGYTDIETKNFIDSSLVNTISIGCTIIITIALFAIILLTSLYIKKKIVNEKKDIGILRVSGYNKKDINIIYLLEMGLTGSLTYMISLLLFM